MTDHDSAMSQRLLNVLRAHPAGIGIAEIRRVLGLTTSEQQQLDRRIRDLRKEWAIDIVRRGRLYLYVIGDARAVSLGAAIDRRTRYRILHNSGGRCAMCGRGATDGVQLQVDHRIPQAWGGTNTDENLWALCVECNHGKRDFFATITDPRIQSAVAHGDIHVRIGELLKSFAPEAVAKEHIKIVAHTHDDFEKRMRELRVIGWEYESQRKKIDGRVRTFFRLTKSAPWPEDPSAEIRRLEKQRKKPNNQ